MSLIGNLAEIKIADVLRLFGAGKKTGLLTVSARGLEALVRFHKGAVVHAAAGRLQGEEALLDLFGWHEGQLTFVPDEAAITPNVKRELDALILEGVRVGESLHRMHELIPSERVVFQLGPGPADSAVRHSIGPAEWRVLRLVDGVHEVRDVVEGSKLPRAEVHHTLLELAEAGLVERIEPLKALRAVVQGLLGKAAAELDERLETDWRRLPRFVRGVHRVEVRNLGGNKSALLPTAFRTGLVRDVALPRTVLAELGVREGDDVQVRPLA